MREGSMAVICLAMVADTPTLELTAERRRWARAAGAGTRRPYVAEVADKVSTAASPPDGVASGRASSACVSWAAGGSRFYTFRRVVMPLIAPSIAVVGLEIFATANAAVGILALLGTGSTQPLSILQLTLLDSGRFEQAAVIGVLIMTMTIVSAMLARYIGHRVGLGHQQQATAA